MEDLKKFIFLQSGRNHLSGKKHMHPNEYELLYVVKGAGRVMIGAKLFPLMPDTLYVINGEDVHNIAPDEKTEYVRTILNLPKKYLHDLFAAAGASKTPHLLLQKGAVHFDVPTAIEMKKAFAAAYEAHGKNMLAFSAALLSLFSICLSVSVCPLPDMDDVISAALSYIDRNITKKMTLDDIATHVYASKYTLCRKFKKSVGMTLGEYLLKRRILV